MITSSSASLPSAEDASWNVVIRSKRAKKPSLSTLPKPAKKRPILTKSNLVSIKSFSEALLNPIKKPPVFIFRQSYSILNSYLLLI